MLQARSAYIHIPFCSHRCGYCNFTLVSGRDDLIPAFLKALERELAQTLQEPRTVETIFLGGGTPTHLSPDELEHLLEIVSRWLTLEAGGEYSSEANPLDCTTERLGLLRDFGVNRLSLGGQSFDDAKLKLLERDHTGAQLSASIDRASAYFTNVSVDLIFAAPRETLKTWQTDVSQALASPIQHLSTYGLTIERGSTFFGRALRQQLHELSTDLQLTMYEHAIDAIGAAGWEHYEVSSFARPGYRCRHNETYWLGQPWLAFGPGAASFEHVDQDAFVRRVNHRSTTSYLRKSQAGDSLVAEREQLSREEFVRERLVFGLRRLQGVDLRELDLLWAANARELFEPVLSQYIQQGWLTQHQSTIRLTSAGLKISDSLWPDLLSQAPV